MDPATFLGLAALAGGLIAFLLAWMLRWHWVRRRSRDLASALVGEIVAILRVIETDEIVRRFGETVRKRPAKSGGIGYRFVIPRPTIYEVNAGRLCVFRAPLPRKIAYFYKLLAGISGKLPSSITDSSPGARPMVDAQHASAALAQLEEALLVADEILNGLRPML
jgi:hypothetical protein